MREKLHSLDAAAAEADVQDNTGFALAIPPTIHTTPAPTADELDCLRTLVRSKLTQSYPDFFAHKIQSTS